MNNWLKYCILYGWELSIISVEVTIFSLASIHVMLGVFDLLKGIFPPEDKKNDWNFSRLLHIIRGCLCIISFLTIMYSVLFLKY